MTEGRGKKAKKARWQVVLGLKQVLFGALGLAWMMIIIFVLGVLAGRGDIYRFLSSWGLVAPAPKMAQWSPPAEAPTAPPPAVTPGTPTPAKPAAPPAAPPSSPAPAPVTGKIIPDTPSTPASSAKKTKKGASLREQKAKEEELQKLRQEVASKLKFQNSFDSPPTKPARASAKSRDKHLAAAGAPKASPKLVRVGQYRDANTAKAKMAELQKKGEKVTLKQGKDKKGVFYEVLRENPAVSHEADRVAQKNPPAGGSKPKKP